MARPAVRIGAQLLIVTTTFVSILLSSSESRRIVAQELKNSLSDDSVKLRVNMINLNVSVVDIDGRFIPGLTKDNFEVYEDKTKQSIDLFSVDDLPVSLGFVFDLSGSMKVKAARARETLREFLKVCNPDNEMFMIGFNNETKLLADFTKDDGEIMNSVAMMPAKGMTALYDAVYMGIEKLKQGRYKRRVLLVISDGQDNSSRYTEREMRNLVKESDVEIFSVGTTAIWQYLTTDDIAGMRMLEDLSDMTGGSSYFPKNFDQMAAICRHISIQLRNQYSLAYIPTNAAFDGNWRKLRVRLKGVKDGNFLVTKTRNGYFARQ